MDGHPEPDLFGLIPPVAPASYPDAPGAYPVETSIEAAEAMQPHCGRLQTVALGTVRDAAQAGVTADEACDRTGLDRWTLQPRLSELRRKGLIADSGQRRRNASGKRAIVWCLPEYADKARVSPHEQG